MMTLAIVLLLAMVLLSLACRSPRRNDYRAPKSISGFEAVELLRRAQGKGKG